MKKICLVFLISVFCVGASAQNNDIFTDAGFTQQDFDDLSKDLMGAFSFTTNSGAGTLGSIWGVEAGLVLGVVPATNLKRIVKEKTGEERKELSYLPAAGIVAAVAAPFGIGAEAKFIPKISQSDVGFIDTGIALRWSVTDLFPLVGTFTPLKLTVKAAYDAASLDYKADQETVSMKVRSLELGAWAGVNLVFVEPYLGLTSVKAKTKLTAETTRVQVPGVYQNAEFKSELSGLKTTLGLLFKLPLLRIGLEYSTVKSINRYGLKLSFKI